MWSLTSPRVGRTSGAKKFSFVSQKRLFQQYRPKADIAPPINLRRPSCVRTAGPRSEIQTWLKLRTRPRSVRVGLLAHRIGALAGTGRLVPEVARPRAQLLIQFGRRTLTLIPEFQMTFARSCIALAVILASWSFSGQAGAQPKQAGMDAPIGSSKLENLPTLAKSTREWPRKIPRTMRLSSS